MIKLVVKRAEGEEEVLSLKKEMVTIGRHRTNDVVLHDASVSRFHAEIEQRGNDYFVRDLDSKNGVFVNDNLVLEWKLASRDRLLIGNTTIEFHILGRDEDTATEDGVCIVEEAQESGSLVVDKKLEMQKGYKILSDLDALAEGELADLRSRLQAHLQLSEVLVTSIHLPDLLNRIMVMIHEQIPYQRGVLMLYDADVDTFVPKVVKNFNINKKGEEIPVSQTIINTCLKERSGVLCSDARRDDRFAQADSVQNYDLRSVLCVPLLGRDRDLGVIHLDSSVTNIAYREEDLMFLMAIGNETSLALENFMLREGSLRNEKMATVGRTIAGLSHYIKNILLISQGSSLVFEKAIAEGDLEELREAWALLKTNNEKLTKLLQDMLHYAKGKPMEFHLTSVNRLIQQLVEQVKMKLEAEHIALNVQMDDRIRNSWLDTEGIYRCVLNLLINAMEALEERKEGREISISTELLDDTKFAVVIQDNGVGITPQELEHIYDPFYTTKGYRGTGLGLALTKKIVLENGGKVECQSEPDYGTSFILTFPIHRTPPVPQEDRDSYYTPFIA
jgi:two-component system NtrC family sensor kinase